MSNSLPFVTFADHRPWLNTSLRALLAIFGAYGLAALSSSVFVLALPLPRVDAVMASVMLSFIIHLLAVIWVFATATLTRAFTGLLLPLIILGVWLSFLPKGAPT